MFLILLLIIFLILLIFVFYMITKDKLKYYRYTKYKNIIFENYLKENIKKISNELLILYSNIAYENFLHKINDSIDDLIFNEFKERLINKKLENDYSFGFNFHLDQFVLNEIKKEMINDFKKNFNCSISHKIN